MIADHLKGFQSLGIYPVISLFIFIFACILILVQTFSADRKYLSKMENLPLDLNSEENKNYGGK